MTRLIRIDAGHFLVPDTNWEVVREHDGRWAVYEDNNRLAVFTTYKNAREWAING